MKNILHFNNRLIFRKKFYQQNVNLENAKIVNNLEITKDWIWKTQIRNNFLSFVSSNYAKKTRNTNSIRYCKEIKVKIA